MAAIFVILLVLGTFSSIKLPNWDPGGSSDPPPMAESITVNPEKILF